MIAVRAVQTEPITPVLRSGIFVLEPVTSLRRQIRGSLSGLPWPVMAFRAEQPLLDALHQVHAGCVIATLENEIVDGLALHQQLAGYQATLALILLTRRIGVAHAVSALRAGVHDLIEMPIIERVLRRRVQIAMQAVENQVDK